MNNQLFENARDWVNQTHPHPEHLIRTGYWVQQLDPTASDELIVACITHDIERAFTEGRVPEGSSEEGSGIIWDDEVYNLWHGRRSADFVAQWLKTQGVSDDFIKKVWRLIEVHEIGGNYEENLIKDADSISFLEINAPLFKSKIPEKFTKEQVIDKFDYMYNRISGEKAKELAKPFYQKAVDLLS